MIESLRAELLLLTSGRPSFDKFPDADIVSTSGLFVLSGADTADDIKNRRSVARVMLIEDLRDDEYKLVDIQLFMDIAHLRHPMIIAIRTKSRKFKEIDTPKKMRGWTADLDHLEGFVKPDRSTVNAITDETPLDHASPPPFAPSQNADFLDDPFAPQDVDRVGAMKFGKSESLLWGLSNPCRSTSGF